MNSKMMTLTGCFGVMVASVAMADISPVGSFHADASDSFENYPSGFVREAVRGFNDNATVMSTSASGWIHTTGSWGFKTTVKAMDGGSLLGSSSNGLAFEFDHDVSAFGAYFATNSGVAGGKISFFDADGVLLDRDPIEITEDGDWTWNAWGSDQAVRRIEIYGNYSGTGEGGFVMMDDASVAFSNVPAPGVLASLGLLTMAKIRRRK